MAANRRQQIRLSPEEQAAFFRERKKAALATIDQDGFPHVVAMNYFARDGAFYRPRTERRRRSSTFGAIPEWR